MFESFIPLLSSPPVMIALIAAIGITLVLFVLAGRGSDANDPLNKLREQSRTQNKPSVELGRRVDTSAVAKRLDIFKSFLEPSSN